MSTVTACGKCGRQLSPEQAATVIVCPDCGAVWPDLAEPDPRAEAPTDSDFAASLLDPAAGDGPQESPTAVLDEPPSEAGAGPNPLAASFEDEADDAETNGAPLRTAGGPSAFAFMLLLSYASALTLACGYLTYLVWSRPANLDLPDLAPPFVEGDRAATLLYVPPEQMLPASNVLRLGEPQRYGSLVVTPLRVTRGPLTFAYFDPQANETRPASDPVLKLHLRCENASADQRFPPLDRRLVFTKEPDRSQPGLYKTNNFVCRVGDRARRDRQVTVFDLAPESPWLVESQNLDRDVPPGAAIDTFIPTTEGGWDELQGSLVWRIHLRKGYNRDSFRGVTTLVEVEFHSDQIEDESPGAPGDKDA